MGLLDRIRRRSADGRKSSAPGPAEAPDGDLVVESSLHLLVNGEISIFPLAAQTTCSIGRDPDSVIVIPMLDREASRRHASVQRLAGGRYVLTDLRSRNGTQVNGLRVEEKVLENGDRITIGGCTLVYHGPEVHPDGVALRPISEQTTVMFKERLVTVLAIDIRDSVTWAKELRDDRWAELVMKIIERARAMFNARRCAGQKYIGDAIMAVWEHENDAVTNTELAQILAAVTDLRKIFGEISISSNLTRPIRFGCGINSGGAAMGYMEGQVALGDAVNKTFRLESTTKDLNCDVVISTATIDYLVRPILRADLPDQRSVQIKGFPNPEPVYAFQFDQMPELAERILTAV